MSDPVNQPNRLRITEIFYSLQGESTLVGLPTVFVRLTGCPLRCSYCDTSYAFTGGQWWEFDRIIEEIRQYPTQIITITGGEPLAQKQCRGLLTALCDMNYTVSLETSGALDISIVDQRVIKIVDIKTPASGESDKNRIENFSYLNKQDQIKFVLCDRTDYDWAKQFLLQYPQLKACEILFSTSYQQLEASQLAQWILDDGLQIRLQIQLHKYLWGNEHGR